MDPAPDALPDDVAALKAALIAERAKRLEVAAELAVARAKASEDMALIAAQKLCFLRRFIRSATRPSAYRQTRHCRPTRTAPALPGAGRFLPGRLQWC